jgi:hypothetical protein
VSPLRKLALAIVGGVIGVLAAVAVLAASSRWSPQHDSFYLPAPLLSETEGPLAEVVVHWVPALDATVADAYADFFHALSPDVSVVMVVPEPMVDEDRKRLERRLANIDPTGALRARTRIVHTPGPITTWSRDRALVTERSRTTQRIGLIAPSEPDDSWLERKNDWETVRTLARAQPDRLEAIVAPFDFDAGDFTVANGTVIVDSNLVEKNRHRGVGDAPELRRRLAAYFGMPVAMLGSVPGDTPRHHLAMTMTPLHDRLVMVGDPAWARELVGDAFAPGEKGSETGQPLRADFSAATIARFDRVARDLTAAGFEVVRIPNVPFDDKTYLTYTNGVYETRSGRRIAYVPVYGIPALDDAALVVYERAGWTTRPIRVRAVYRYHGTIGCLVNVVGRG